MKKRLFGLKAKDKRNLSRYKEDVVDFDEDFDEDDYRDDYDDEDYPDDYEDDDYPDEDYEDDDRYEDDEYYPEDEVENRREERYSEDDRYDDEDDYPEDEVEDDRYEDYPEEEVEDDRYEDDDYPEDEVDNRRDEKRYSEDDRYDDEEDYPEDRYEDDDDYPEDEVDDDRYEDDDYPEDNYEDEEYYPEDEDEDAYYPGDARYEDRRGRGRRDRDRGESIPAKIFGFLANTSATERIAAIFAILILAGGIATASFYMKAMGNRQQLDSFVEVGSELGTETIYGQSGLIAVADAERARAMAAELISDDAFMEEEEEEVPDDAENVTIKMTLTSIKSDMKVKFINSQTGKLVANLPLEIDVETPDGSKVTYNDHDQDGIIYKKDITAGVYKITPKALPSGYENYKLEIKTQSLTVKDQVEMKAVDVSNEVKKESQVNAAKEDTAVKTEVESQLKDTVEWVESTKTAIGEYIEGNNSYKKIDKNDIVDPSKSSMVGIRPWMFMALSRSTASTNANAEITDDPPATSAEPGTGASAEASSAASDEASTEKSGESNGDNNGDNNTTNPSNPDNPTPPARGELRHDVNPSKIKVGENAVITATGSSKTISFTIEGDCVEEVSNSGNGSYTVKGKKQGEAKIKISADDCNSVTATVIVEAAPTPAEDQEIQVDNASLTVKIGGQGQAIGIHGPSKCTFEYDTNYIAVSESGVVTGKKGTDNVTITIKAQGYKDKTINVKVEKKDMVISTKNITLEIGKTVNISDKFKVTEPTQVKLVPSDTNIIKIENDKITALKESSNAVTIAVQDESGVYKEDVITVKIENPGNKNIKLEKKEFSLKIGDKAELKITEPTSGVTFKSSDEKIVKVITEGGKNYISAIGDGNANITVSATNYNNETITVKVVKNTTELKTRDGKAVYVKDGDKYRKATYDDYFNKNEFFLLKETTDYKYTGWQTLDGKTYFFDKNGNYVTGEQVIQGAKYSFGSDGVLSISAGGRGIDVSKWNGNIDWAAVKNSGINFVIIRCGYRGSSEGALIEDPTFRRNIQGAQNAGIRVGIYFFTQAVNEVEAVEEASMVINLIKGYNISYPVYLDVEASHGRGDGISAAQRTANIKAFCGTIQNAGYKAGVYANKTWFTSYINTSQITNYKIWLAQYAEAVTYNGSRYDMWQYTSKGRVTGINGFVDMNICY